MSHYDDVAPGKVRVSAVMEELAMQLKEERLRPRPPHRPQGYRLVDIPERYGKRRTIERLERGEGQKANIARVIALCDFYKTPDELKARIIELAEATHADRWWETYSKGMVDKLWLLLQRETRAARIRCHDSLFIPALLQHESYIDAISKSTNYVIEGDGLDIETAQKLRLDRQRRWRDSGVPITAVIGEAALLLNMGPGVQDAQKELLLKLAELPHVDILVTPLSAGRHDVMGTEVNILDFANGSERLVCIGAVGAGPVYLDPDSDLGVFFSKCFNTAQSMSIPIKEYYS